MTVFLSFLLSSSLFYLFILSFFLSFFLSYFFTCSFFRFHFIFYSDSLLLSFCLSFICFVQMLHKCIILRPQKTIETEMLRTLLHHPLTMQCSTIIYTSCIYYYYYLQSILPIIPAQPIIKP